MKKIIAALNKLKDPVYLEFNSSLIPNIPKERFIGVRTKELKSLAKTIYKNNDYKDFLNEVPHYYFDENQLHVFIISLINDFKNQLLYVEKFLPFIDNWATCDQLSPKTFLKNKEEVKEKIKEWLKSDEIYTIRFAIGQVMSIFIDDFDVELTNIISKIRSDEYYLNMMIAWFFSTLIAKRYDDGIKYLENNCLSKWVHNKTISKCIDSYRVSDDEKAYLKTLRKKNHND